MRGFAAAPHLAPAPRHSASGRPQAAPTPPLPPAEAREHPVARAAGGKPLPLPLRKRKTSLTAAEPSTPPQRALSGTLIGPAPPIAAPRCLRPPARTPAPGAPGKIRDIAEGDARPRQPRHWRRHRACAPPGGERAGKSGGAERAREAAPASRPGARESGRSGSAGRRRGQQKLVVARAGPRLESPPGGGGRGAECGSRCGREVSAGLLAEVASPVGREVRRQRWGRQERSWAGKEGRSGGSALRPRGTGRGVPGGRGTGRRDPPRAVHLLPARLAPAGGVPPCEGRPDTAVSAGCGAEPGGWPAPAQGAAPTRSGGPRGCGAAVGGWNLSRGRRGWGSTADHPLCKRRGRLPRERARLSCRGGAGADAGSVRARAWS